MQNLKQNLQRSIWTYLGFYFQSKENNSENIHCGYGFVLPTKQLLFLFFLNCSLVLLQTKSCLSDSKCNLKIKDKSNIQIIKCFALSFIMRVFINFWDMHISNCSF